MVENLKSAPETRFTALENFVRNKDMTKATCRQCRRDVCCQGNSSSKTHDGFVEAVTCTPVANSRSPKRCTRSPSMVAESSPKRKKVSSSKFYGVRFRRDLSKWVAEIRVHQWKQVDKKIWLGTFSTEEAAARGVDVARKLLGCPKSKLPNLPCKELDAYSERLPPTLVLTDLTRVTMYKEATNFIKAKSQEYAKRFSVLEGDDSNRTLHQIEEGQEFDGTSWASESTVHDPGSSSEELTIEDYPVDEFHGQFLDQIPYHCDATTASSCLASQETGNDAFNLSQSTASSKSRGPMTTEDDTQWAEDSVLNVAGNFWSYPDCQCSYFQNPPNSCFDPILGQDPPTESSPWEDGLTTGETGMKCLCSFCA